MLTKDPSLLQKEYCQISHQALLRCLADDPKSIRPSLYVRLLQGTIECDKFHDMREHRKALSTLINIDDKECLNRVLKFKETTADDKVVQWAMRSCVKSHQEELVKALTWPNYLYFQTIERVKRCLSKYVGKRMFV